MSHRKLLPDLSVRVAVLACALAVAAGGCIKLPWQRWSKWKAVRSKHVTIYTDTKFLYGHSLETFEYAHAALSALPLFRAQSIAPVEVLFLEEPEFIAELGRFRSGISVAQLPGEGRLGPRSLVVVQEDTSMHVAAHRLAHLFLQAKLPRAPLWLHEAFASYYDDITYAKDEKGIVACFGYLGGANKMVPLAELFALSWQGFDGSGKAEWYRYTARTLLDYIYFGDNGKLRSAIPILVGRIAVGGTTEQAVAAALPGLSVAELDRRMVDFRKESEMHPRSQCPLSVPVPPDMVADLGQPQSEPVSAEDIKQLARRVRLLPHRSGHVDWYPPEAVTIEPAAAVVHPPPSAAEQGGAP